MKNNKKLSLLLLFSLLGVTTFSNAEIRSIVFKRKVDGPYDFVNECQSYNANPSTLPSGCPILYQITGQVVTSVPQGIIDSLTAQSWPRTCSINVSYSYNNNYRSYTTFQAPNGSTASWSGFSRSTTKPNAAACIQDVLALGTPSGWGYGAFRAVGPGEGYNWLIQYATNVTVSVTVNGFDIGSDNSNGGGGVSDPVCSISGLTDLDHGVIDSASVNGNTANTEGSYACNRNASVKVSFINSGTAGSDGLKISLGKGLESKLCLFGTNQTCYGGSNGPLRLSASTAGKFLNVRSTLVGNNVTSNEYSATVVVLLSPE